MTEAGHLEPGVVGAVLCGGRSRRFGSDKALAPTGDGTMGQRVVDAMRGAGMDPVVAVGGDAGAALGLITVPDRWPGLGPLGGLATVLRWARRGDVLVVPCDLPLLDQETVSRLLDARHRIRPQGGPEAERVIVAAVDGEPRHSLAIWPAGQARTVRRLVDDGERRFRAALDAIGWVPVEVLPAGLDDADTPQQLDELLDRSRGRATPEVSSTPSEDRTDGDQLESGPTSSAPNC